MIPNTKQVAELATLIQEYKNNPFYKDKVLYLLDTYTHFRRIRGIIINEDDRLVIRRWKLSLSCCNVWIYREADSSRIFCATFLYFLVKY